MGFFPKKSDSSAKMKVMKVSVASASKKAAAKPVKGAKKSAKPMSFTEWVEHYAKMSGGNPV